MYRSLSYDNKQPGTWVEFTPDVTPLENQCRGAGGFHHRRPEPAKATTLCLAALAAAGALHWQRRRMLKPKRNRGLPCKVLGRPRSPFFVILIQACPAGPRLAISPTSICRH